MCIREPTMLQYCMLLIRARSNSQTLQNLELPPPGQLGDDSRGLPRAAQCNLTQTFYCSEKLTRTRHAAAPVHDVMGHFIITTSCDVATQDTRDTHYTPAHCAMNAMK